jgi:hypothetical protein
MLTNQTLTNLSSSSNFSDLNQTYDDNFILLYPELFNTIVLTTVLVPVYKGIEIEHPIYKILFSNLCVSLLSSITNFAFFFFPIKVLKFTRSLCYKITDLLSYVRKLKFCVINTIFFVLGAICS